MQPKLTSFSNYFTSINKSCLSVNWAFLHLFSFCGKNQSPASPLWCLSPHTCWGSFDLNISKQAAEKRSTFLSPAAPNFCRTKTWCNEWKGLETLKNHLRRKTFQMSKSPSFHTQLQLKKQQIWESRQFWSEKSQRISALLLSPELKMQQLLKVMLWCSTCPKCWI